MLVGKHVQPTISESMYMYMYRLVLYVHLHVSNQGTNSFKSFLEGLGDDRGRIPKLTKSTSTLTWFRT